MALKKVVRTVLSTVGWWVALKVPHSVASLVSRLVEMRVA